MKTCTICTLSFPLDQFNRKSSAKDGLQNVCRPCNRASSRRYYKENPGKHREAVSARNRIEKDKLQQLLGQYLLDHPCVDCGQTDIRLLDCDHRGDEIKRLEVSKMIAGQYKWAVILNELSKCDTRCRNCHILKTYERAGSRDWRTRFMAAQEG